MMTIGVQSDSFTVRRIFCIGRNYPEHAAELANEIPSEPVVFMKPLTCLVPPGAPIPYPPYGNDLHHEIEVVLHIGEECVAIDEDHARQVIDGIALGVDLTLRDVQSALKKKGLPWEKAKSFDGSSPLGDFVPLTENIDLNDIAFSLHVNGSLRQKGNTGQTLFSMTRLVALLSTLWKLLPGDVIYTGTPSGVASLQPGDRIDIESPLLRPATWTVVETHHK